MQFPHLSIVLEPIIVLLVVLIGQVALVAEEASLLAVASAEAEEAVVGSKSRASVGFKKGHQSVLIKGIIWF